MNYTKCMHITSYQYNIWNYCILLWIMSMYVAICIYTLTNLRLNYTLPMSLCICTLPVYLCRWTFAGLFWYALLDSRVICWYALPVYLCKCSMLKYLCRSTLLVYLCRSILPVYFFQMCFPRVPCRCTLPVYRCRCTLPVYRCRCTLPVYLCRCTLPVYHCRCTLPVYLCRCTLPVYHCRCTLPVYHCRCTLPVYLCRCTLPVYLCRCTLPVYICRCTLPVYLWNVYIVPMSCWCISSIPAKCTTWIQRSVAGTLHLLSAPPDVLLRHVRRLAPASRHRGRPCDAGQCLLPGPGDVVSPHGLRRPLHGHCGQLRRLCQRPWWTLLHLHSPGHLQQGRGHDPCQAQPQIDKITEANKIGRLFCWVTL